MWPTIEGVNAADRRQICRWYRFLPSATTEIDQRAQTRLAERFKELGGFTPELSKEIGWE